MAADVLVTRRLPASAIEKLGEVGTVDMHRAPDGLPPAQLQDRVRGVKALVCSATDVIDEPLLAAADLLRVVATVAVGYDNIDVDAARRRRIIVTHTPDVLTAAVAETTWGLILAITHRIVEGDRLIRRGAWTRWSLDFMLGTELRGKRLGIVGAGRIGRAVAARADAFGMEAVFSARVGERDGAPTGRDDLPRVSFDELLEVFFVIHDPTTLNYQGNDVGTQYRSAVFCVDEEQAQAARAYVAKLGATERFATRRIVTQIEGPPAPTFWPAEEAHQDYHLKHGGSCQVIVR